MDIRGKGKYVDGTRINNVLKGEIPPYPGASIIPPVMIPPPPQIPNDATESERAAILAQCYRAAVTNVLGRRCYSFARGDIAKSKPYKTLVTASRLLEKYKTAPLAWSMWSCGVWKKWKGSSKNPPITWVYGMPRIDGKIDVFNREYVDSSARSVLTQSHRVLLNRYTEMTVELTKLENLGATEQQRKQVVDTYFPDGMYWRLVDRINSERDSYQQAINVRINRGEWVW